MIKPKLGLKNSYRYRYEIILLLSSYIFFSELIKLKAEIYILEQSLELKLVLFSLVIVSLYKISYFVIGVVIIVLLLLTLFNIPTGHMIYVFVFYAFIKLLKRVMQASYE